MNSMTPSEEKTVDEKMREAGQTAETLRRYLGWDKEALAIVMLQDPEATMKFKASYIQDIWNHCVSLCLTNQRLEAEVAELRAGIEKHRESCAMPYSKMGARIEELEAEVERMRGSVIELVGAMRRYEMNVDEEPPHEHADMMERAESCLRSLESRGEQKGEL